MVMNMTESAVQREALRTQDVDGDDCAVYIRGLSHAFETEEGELIPAVDNVDLTLKYGEAIAIVGPSGCGKTTILNIAAGLEKYSVGEVKVAGKTVRDINRSVGYMFARDGLLPWRTASKNIELGLELRGVPRAERTARSEELLGLVGLPGFGGTRPARLSQGMRQRVALARTLASEPDVLMLDEPFAALDAQSKAGMQAEFNRIIEITGKASMLVTHDIEEAVLMADRVFVMSNRPCSIVEVIEVNEPRPRDLNTFRFTPEFLQLTKRVWDALWGNEDEEAN